MSDDVILKKVDKLTMLIRQLERDLPEINQRIDRIERTQRGLRYEIDHATRLITGRVAIPPAWASIATHEEPMMMM
ncbi:MAG TPA: hypothetical protein VET84_03310 [Stellaceae bacterium]|nr:hypothetical protein [Stellaceae bacterium]